MHKSRFLIVNLSCVCCALFLLCFLVFANSEKQQGDFEAPIAERVASKADLVKKQTPVPRARKSQAQNSPVYFNDPQGFEQLPKLAADFLMSEDDARLVPVVPVKDQQQHPEDASVHDQEHPELEGRELQRVVGGLDPKNRYRVARIVESDFKYPKVRHEEWWRATANGPELIRRVSMVADHVMVRLQPGQDSQALEVLVAKFDGGVRRQLPNSDIYLVSFKGEQLDQMTLVLNELSIADIVFSAAEPDYIVHAIATPGDSSFSQLYAMHNEGQTGGTVDADIDAVEAWDLGTGSRDVLVGIIDTGVDYNHPDLAANIWTNEIEFNGTAGVDDDGNGYVDDIHGYDFSNNDADPMDGNSHGTHVGGTIGGVGDNGLGVAGVCWQVSMAGIKFLSDAGSGATSDAIESVNYSALIGCDLTNNSWGGGGFSQQLSDAIYDSADETAPQNEVLFIAAAGNSGANNDVTPHYPSSYAVPNIVSVASTDHRDLLSSFSCYGATSVDLAAPGSAIYSTIPGGSYASKSGTSMATPHVAGAAALLKSHAPSLSAADVKQALMSSVDQLSVLSGKMISGGRLNVHELVLPYAGTRFEVTQQTLLEDGTVGSIGNGDLIHNPGERIAFNITFKNVGVELAEGVEATVQQLTADPLVTFAGPVVAQLGDVASQAEMQIPVPYLVDINAAHAVPETIAFNIHVTATSTSDTWDFPISIPVAGSSLMNGVVRTLTGGVPVAGAIINFDGPMSAQMVSDGSGEFAINLMDGSYVVRSNAAGYVETEEAVTLPVGSTLEILVGRPEITYAPAAFAVTVGENPVIEMLSIGNTGDLPLHVNLEYIPNRNVSIFSQALQTAATVGIYNDGDQWSDKQEPVMTGMISVDDISAQVSGLNCLYITTLLPDNGSDVFSTALSNLPQIGSLTVYDGRSKMPTTNELLAFDVVVVSANTSWYNASGLGNNLANYADNGGVVILLVAGFANTGSYGLQGRIITSDYLPLQMGGPGPSGSASTFATHPITQGVSSVTCQIPVTSAATQGGGISLGTLTNGYLVGAVHSNSPVIALNVYPSNGSWSGDWLMLLANSINYMSTKDPLIALSQTSVTVAPGGSIDVPITITGNQAPAGFYETGVVLRHDDPIADNPLVVHADVTVLSYKAIESDPVSIDFGIVVIGEPVQRVIELSNTGNDDVTITAVSLTLVDCVHDLSLPAVIPSGETFTIVLDLNTSSENIYNGELQLDSDADNVAQLIIPLTADSRSVGLAETFAWDVFPDPEQDEAFVVTLRAEDVYGNLVSDYTGTPTVMLKQNSSHLLITECDPGSPDFIEIQNVSSLDFDATGYFVAVSDDYNNINSANTVVWSLNQTFSSGELAYKTDSTADNYWGNNILWNHSTNSWAVIADADGNVVDAVFWNWSESDIQSFAPVVNGKTLNLNGQWLGAGVPYVSNTIQRIGSSDTDDASDWAWQSPSKNATNSGLAVPFGQSGGVVTPSQIGPFVGGAWTGEVSVNISGLNLQMTASDAGIQGDSALFHIVDTFMYADRVHVDFGALVVNRITTQDIHLINTGTAPTFISTIATDLANCTHNLILPATVPAGGSVTLRLEYQPDALGAKAGTLRIESNADDNPQIDITLAAQVNSHGALNHFVLEPIADQAYLNPFNVRVRAMDAYDNLVTSYAGAVDLSVAVSETTLLITECHPGTPDFIEIQNVSSQPFSCDGYFVAASNSGSINSANQVVWSLSGAFAGEEIQYRTDSTADNYWGNNLNWVHNSEGWVVIADATGLVVDAVFWGYTDAQIAEFAPTVNGVTLQLNGMWTGNGVALTANSIQRIGTEDTELAADWAVQALSKNAVNQNLTLPWSSGSDLAVSPEQSAAFSAGEWTGSVVVSGYGAGLRMRATDGNQQGLSNTFDILYSHLDVGSSLSFLDTPINTHRDMTLELNNAGTYPVSINNIQTNDTVFTVLEGLPLIVPANGVETLTVRFAPTAHADYNAQLTIISDAIVNPHVQVGLVGSCKSDPSVTVNPTAFDVRVAYGESLNLDLLINNTGGATLQAALFETVDAVTALGQGSPDAFGYSWRDSNEANGPVFIWNDISTTGTALSISNVDDGSAQVALSFAFPFYGEDYNEMYVSSNGYITLSAAYTSYSNYQLPSGSMPPALIAAFYDDLYPGGGGTIYFEDFETHVVVQFDNVRRLSGTGIISFQMVLHANGRINFYYDAIDLSTPNSATIGIQNHLRNVASQVSYNQSYVSDELAVEIKNSTDWLSLSETNVAIEGFSSEAIQVMIDATELEIGTYTGSIRVNSNDPIRPTVLVPVNLTVSGLSFGNATIWGHYHGSDSMEIYVDGLPATITGRDWQAHADLGGDVQRVIRVHAADGDESYDEEFDVIIDKNIVPLSGN